MKKKLVFSVIVVLLLVMVFLACVACTPNCEDVESKLKDNGYNVNISSDIEHGEKWGITKGLGAKRDVGDVDSDYVTIYWFSNLKKRNAYYEEIKKWYKDAEKSAKLDGIELRNKVVKKGNAVVFGTKTAVKLVG